MLIRAIESQVEKFFKASKYRLLFIWGPRRSGKTTLLEKLSRQYKTPVFNFDLLSDREKFQPRQEILDKLVAEHRVILIDEVQNAPEATVVLKILADNYKVKIIATGSSELRQKAGVDWDSLADRFEEAYCLPLSTAEIVNNAGLKKYELVGFSQNLSERLQLFGCYPEIYAGNLSAAGKMAKLERIIDTYVLKDIIEIYDLKNIKLAKEILTKIALQLGSEVSLREIASSLQANVATVSNYIEIFIKNYILIPLPSFKTNIRRAVSENRKLYFYDLGIRNALVKDFREMKLRPDSGGVWENFIVSELVKQKLNNGRLLSFYFYREYSGKEVDIVIEDYRKRYVCLEVKKTKGGANRIFPLKHRLESVTRENYLSRISSLLKF